MEDTAESLMKAYEHYLDFLKDRGSAVAKGRLLSRAPVFEDFDGNYSDNLEVREFLLRYVRKEEAEFLEAELERMG